MLTKDFPQVLAAIYDKSQLQTITIPYSTANLERLNTILNFYGGCLQNLVFFSHNNFEIHILVEKLPTASSSLDNNLEEAAVEKLFVQFIALFKTAKSYGLDFLDFSRFCIDAAGCVRFPIELSKKIVPPINSIIEIFQKQRCFKNLSEGNYKEIFADLTGKYHFPEEHCYIYRFSDFAANKLNLSRPGSSGNIKIKIKTAAAVLKKIIAINLFNGFNPANVSSIFIDNNVYNNKKKKLPVALMGILLQEEQKEACAEPPGFVNAAGQLKLFLKKSSGESLVLSVDNLKTKEESEFIKYLLDSSGIPGILLIVFGENDFIDFDLTLKESPPNLLDKYLGFYNIEERQELTQQEIYLLKVFKTISHPLSQEALPTVFSSEECGLVETLIGKKYLKIAAAKILLNVSLPALNIEVGKDEEKEILKLYLDKFDSMNLMLKNIIKTGRPAEIKKILKKFLQNRCKLADGMASAGRIFFDNFDFLQKEVELVRLFAEVFLKEGDLSSARELAERCREQDPVFLDLKLAHVYKLEKDYLSMEQILRSIPGQIPAELKDEFFYLKFICTVKKSGFQKAEKYHKKISGELYRHLAAIQLSDRYIYGGEPGKAAQLLDEAAAFLSEKRYSRAELDARNQQAKLLRQKGAYDEAEKLYLNVFIESEINDYKLLSAQVAVDTGNFFHLIRENSNRAESWYKKALTIYREQGNRNGQALVESNLAEISKIKGSWQEAEDYLKSALNYDREQRKVVSLAVDYYNIAHLEYLRHNYTKALEFIDSAISLFEEKENLLNKIESGFLKLKILFLTAGKPAGVDFLEQHSSLFSPDQQVLFSLLRAGEKKGSRLESAGLSREIEKIASQALRFESLALLLKKHKLPGLLEKLRSLSMAASKGIKDYYYYEYYYIYFSYFSTAGEMAPEEREIFFDVYYFFLRNKRKISARLGKLKNALDEKDSTYDLFKSAALVGDYQRWKVPGDFFKSLLKEIEKAVPVDLVKLVIYEKGEPLFDFSAPNKFSDLTTEMINAAAASLENLDLDLEAVKSLYKSEERVFYFFKNTKVILWRISDALFAVLLLAFVENTYADYDFFDRQKDLLEKFATLIRRYYENDYKLNRKLGFIIGESLAMKTVKDQILRVGKVDFPVSISGESGSGKELVARGVHIMSARAGKPFIPVNSAAIPENLLEAELFGYKKGAFTGAGENRTGLIEAAHQGTLFLDEIADLPMGLQAKLLRALQEQEVRRLGENKTIKVDFRLISATNKDLKAMARENRFREDLYYRLEVLQIKVPPLRDRIEDIPLLAEYFLKKNNFPIEDKLEFQGIVEFLKSREWPGNVRELESSIKRLITYYPDFEIGETVDYKTEFSLGAAKANLEKYLVSKALKENDWHKVNTARALKISRMYLFNLIKKYNLTPPRGTGGL